MSPVEQYYCTIKYSMLNGEERDFQHVQQVNYNGGACIGSMASYRLSGWNAPTLAVARE